MKIFVCFPLSHSDKTIFDSRVKSAKEYCRNLLKEGHTPFSPALVGLDLLSNLPENEQDVSFPTWEQFCYSYLEPVDEVHVLRLKGWSTSKGIAGEVNKAKELGKSVIYVEK